MTAAVLFASPGGGVNAQGLPSGAAQAPDTSIRVAQPIKDATRGAAAPTSARDTSAIQRIHARSAGEASSDSGREGGDPRGRSRFEQPRWVMLRSLVVPGWGQVHNRAWIKAALLAGTEVALCTRLVNDDRALGRLKAVSDAAQAADDLDGFNQAVAAYNARLDESINRRWLLGGLLIYALLDAYVDAHFVHFEAEFEHDPALPEGVKPPSEMRLSVEWPF